jgi:hypothetical protein
VTQGQWVHVGRLWTNGDPFLAVDAKLREAWRGFSDERYFDEVVELGPAENGIAVGEGRAVLVGADAEVRDDSWMEVFTSADGDIAIVQASGPDYRQAVADALRYPSTVDDLGELLVVDSGELAIFTAAADGSGEYSVPLRPVEPGEVPTTHGPPTEDGDPGLLLKTSASRYRLTVRWHTPLGEGSFARWLLTPA